MTFFTRPPCVESPCNKICTLDPAAGLCIGCGRNLDEIASWIGYNDAERRRIMAELPTRLLLLRRQADAECKPG
jgi:uncharacterized protein